LFFSDLYFRSKIGGELLNKVNFSTVPYAFFSDTANNSLYLGGVLASSYLTSYTDSNASTACSGTTTYLDGEGNCDDISSVYAPISVTGDNASWNQSLADTLYADISVVDTDTNCSVTGSCNTILYTTGFVVSNVTNLVGNDSCGAGYVVQNVSLAGGGLTIHCVADVTGGVGGTNVYNATSYYYNKTSKKFDGNLTSYCNFNLYGYECGDYICNSNFTGTHLCRQDEIITTIHHKNVSTMVDWAGDVWVSSGGPKYAPATIPANDCNGFTDGTVSYLGSYWNFNQDGGGDGRMINCGTEIALACCKNW
jgi:hypothetical protein